MGLCRRIRTVYDTLTANRNASMISVVLQNFIFDVHDARRAFATGPTAHGTGHAFSMYVVRSDV